jgi:hypothetical protein
MVLHIIEDPHEKESWTIRNIRDQIREFVESIYKKELHI